MPLSVVCLVASVALLVIQMLGTDKIASSPDSLLMAPPPVTAKWEVHNADGTWTNNFARYLPALQP